MCALIFQTLFLKFGEYGDTPLAFLFKNTKKGVSLTTLTWNFTGVFLSQSHNNFSLPFSNSKGQRQRCTLYKCTEWEREGWREGGETTRGREISLEIKNLSTSTFLCPSFQLTLIPSLSLSPPSPFLTTCQSQGLHLFLSLTSKTPPKKPQLFGFHPLFHYTECWWKTWDQGGVLAPFWKVPKSPLAPVKFLTPWLSLTSFKHAPFFCFLIFVIFDLGWWVCPVFFPQWLSWCQSFL